MSVATNVRPSQVERHHRRRSQIQNGILKARTLRPTSLSICDADKDPGARVTTGWLQFPGRISVWRHRPSQRTRRERPSQAVRPAPGRTSSSVRRLPAKAGAPSWTLLCTSSLDGNHGMGGGPGGLAIADDNLVRGHSRSFDSDSPPDNGR